MHICLAVDMDPFSVAVAVSVSLYLFAGGYAISNGSNISPSLGRHEPAVETLFAHFRHDRNPVHRRALSAWGYLAEITGKTQVAAEIKPDLRSTTMQDAKLTQPYSRIMNDMVHPGGFCWTQSWTQRCQGTCISETQLRHGRWGKFPFAFGLKMWPTCEAFPRNPTSCKGRRRIKRRQPRDLIHFRCCCSVRKRTPPAHREYPAWHPKYCSHLPAHPKPRAAQKQHPTDLTTQGDSKVSAGRCR